MKKMRLDMDELRVDTFSTTPECSNHAGTVFGQVEESEGRTCNPVSAFCTNTTNYSQTCEYVNTCNPTCAGDTCGYATCGECNPNYSIQLTCHQVTCNGFGAC